MVVGESTLDTQVLVLGAGPGGYAAAFRAADLGLDVTMVAREPLPGGVCLYEGCIPSKTLLYLAQLLYDARRAGAMGINFGTPQVDVEALRAWKGRVTRKLSDGLVTLARKRDVQTIRAIATFDAPDRVRLEGSDFRYIRFRHAIVATGARPMALPGVEFRPGGRVMDSSGALALPDVPETLMVVGGGTIGLELGMIYASLGSRVTLVELTDGLMPGSDRDLVRVLARRVAEMFAAVHVRTRVTGLQEDFSGVIATLAGEAGARQERFDRVLVTVGRSPNSEELGLETAGVQVDPHGFVRVDEQRRTSQPGIFAIGDVVGGAMLAHKAMREGKVAAEVIAGKPSAFDVVAIPAVVYTNPQLAWCGLTEEAAKRDGRPVQLGRFPWAASGRATTFDAVEGLTKVIFDPDTKRVLGMGIVGRDAGELIAEGVLAVEMGALAGDLAFSMHPHPTLSETEGETAEAFLGSATHILPPRR